ncbi:MAG: complement resistance protein TraT [Pseudomonadota bacterium]
MTGHRNGITAGLMSLLVAWGCAPEQRMGMVVDPRTGLQYGSVIERNLVVDASQLENRKLKLAIRNTSGDPAFDLRGFRSSLESAFAAKGYQPTAGDDFGVLVDINVRFSGQASSDMANRFGFLGAAAGGLAGYGTQRDHSGSAQLLGTGIGVVSGATLGAILGSYVREDTYIVVAGINVAVVDPERGKTSKTIVFGASERREREIRTGVRPFSQRLETSLAVYAGGRSVPQGQIVDGVRDRFLSILSDVI